MARIRSFKAVKGEAIEQKELHKLILEMEKKYDLKFNSIEQVINYLLEEKKTEQLQKSRRRIGFKASKTK